MIKNALLFLSIITMSSCNIFLLKRDIQNNDNEFNVRSSLGVSFDVLTAVGPISLSYAVPIEKNTNDITNEFNFSIGTSF